MGKDRPTANRIEPNRMTKEAEAFRTISEAAEALGVPQHVLRFWELKFPQLSPLKRGGGRRYYRPGEIALLGSIRDLLYADGYTIKGVQRLLREQGVRAVSGRAARSQSPGDSQLGGDPDEPSDAAGEPGLAIQDPLELQPADASNHRFSIRITALAAELDECAAMLAAAAFAARQAFTA